MSTIKGSSITVHKLRNYILGIYFISGIGLLAELILLEHYEGFWQMLPLVLISISFIMISWLYFKNTSFSKKGSQLVMILMIVGGCWGLWMHYTGNTEFELELHPSVGGFELFWNSIKGATPVLAPGALVGLGLTGLVYTLIRATAADEVIN